MLSVNEENIMLKLILILSPAEVCIDGVLQPSWKYKKRSVCHFHNDLIGVLRGQFRHRWPDDPCLHSRIVKIDGICSLVRLGVINTAHEVVWVAVNAVRR